MSTNGVTSPASQLLERLNDPQVAGGLNRLLDRLDTLSFAVESMEGFINRGEVIAESIADSVDDLKNRGGDESLGFIQRAPELIQTGTRLADAAGSLDVENLAESGVLERLTDPQTLATVNRMLDQLPLAAFLLEAVEGFIGRGETIAENLAEGAREMTGAETSIQLEDLSGIIESLPKLKEAGEKLLGSELMGDGLQQVIEAGVGMVESGMLDKEVVQVLGELGRLSARTYQEVASQPVQPVGGLFATLRAMKDPDVQKSTGFLFAFAKAFAKHLK